MQAYNKGTPIISDTEFDELKLSLRTSNSKIAGEKIILYLILL